MIKTRWFQIALSAVVALVAVNSLSCGNGRKLTQIEIHPAAATFLDPSPGPNNVILFTAQGIYLHPSVTRDLTSKVAWKTDTPGLLVVTGGQVSPFGGGACGVGDISAESVDRGNLIIGYATATVNDPSNPNCPGGSATKGVVTVALAGPGSVASSPGGITCPSTCGSQFTVGDTIVLSATPSAGHTFGGWTSCPSPSTTSCTITVLKGSVNVSANFI